MKRQYVFAMIALALAAPAVAQEAQAAGDSAQQGTQQREHVVKVGDTLWDLAQFYYHDPWQWSRIFEANTGTVQNPHWIYPTEHLIIPALADTSGVPARVVAVQRPGRTSFYTAQPASAQPTQGPTVLTEETKVQPDVLPGDFYAAPWLQEPKALRVVGKLVKVQSTQKLSWRMTEAAYPYDVLYLAYETAERPAVGERLVLVNVGRKVGDYGKVIRPAAFVDVRSKQREVMEVQVVKQFEPVTTGALAIRYEEFPAPAEPKPQPVANGPTGKIVAFSQNDAMYGVEATAFISLGSADGVKIGDELEAYVPEHFGNKKRVKQLLPEETVADLRIVRVMERSATARVFHLMIPALDSGLPVRVVRKMP
ncbi:MAG TPA: LysM peptidoglycan-binding domain-containing protein [Longimicrobiales bacterium]|nr:LysM peptidoglycan-binding domain-containing protein [Longimicrobiales bacterium]